MSGAAVLQGHGVNFVKLSRRRRHLRSWIAGCLALSRLSLKSSRECWGGWKLAGLAVALATQECLRAIYARRPAFDSETELAGVRH